MRKSIVASAIGTTLFLGACQLLLGIEDRAAVQRPEDASVPDAPTDAGVDATDPCTLQNLPARPDASDLGSDRDLVFALTAVDFGIDGGLRFGLNLDKQCTCPATDTCQRPPNAVTACDAPEGVDNATVGVLRALRSTKVLDETTLNQNLQTGGSGALLRIQKYNGRPDDPYVAVSIYGSLGIEGPLTTQPEDRWRVDVESVNGGDLDRPKHRDDNAYVAGSTLVAALNFPLSLGGDGAQPPLTTELSSGYVVAKIDVAAGTLSGVLAGRWATKTALKSIQSFPDNGSSTMCGDSGTFGFIQSFICGAADISQNPEGDNRGDRCNALSVHIGFESRLATFGTVRQRPDSGLPSCNRDPECP